MRRLGRGVRAVLRFWVDFIVGDDPLVAASVAAALLGTGALVHAGLPAWWLLPLAAIVATTVSLRRASNPQRRADAGTVQAGDPEARD